MQPGIGAWSFRVFGALLLLAAYSTAPAQQTTWQGDWEKTLEAGKREGRVTLYGSSSIDLSLLFAGFEKRYPEIKMDFFPGTGGQVVQRLLAERRAGKYLADLAMHGLTTNYALYQAKAFDPIKPLLVLPEVTDTSKWWQEKHHYKDAEEQYIFAFNAGVLPHFGYNSQIVNPKEFRSYWDILKPQWKGKIIVRDPSGRSGGLGGLRFMYYNPELGPGYISRLLGDMDVATSSDSRQIVDWLAAGKYAFSVLAVPRRDGLGRAKKQGLPVDWFGPGHMNEGIGLSVSSGSIGFVNRAPHPHTTKILVNWLFSREGQMAFQKVAEGDSLRIDLPKDEVPPDVRRIEGAKYVEDERPEYLDMRPIYKVVNEALARAQKK